MKGKVFSYLPFFIVVRPAGCTSSRKSKAGRFNLLARYWKSCWPFSKFIL